MPQMTAGSSPKSAVAVNFAEVCEEPLDVVEGLRTLRMPRQFRFLPRGLQPFHFLLQRSNAAVKLRELAVRFFAVVLAVAIVARRAFDQRDLQLDLVQFVLRVRVRCHK